MLFNNEIFISKDGKVHTPNISPIYRLLNEKSDSKAAKISEMVELVENCLHPIIGELQRWQGIIGEHYIDHKIEEQRNSLADKPEGYNPYILT